MIAYMIYDSAEELRTTEMTHGKDLCEHNRCTNNMKSHAVFQLEVHHIRKCSRRLIRPIRNELGTSSPGNSAIWFSPDDKVPLYKI